MTKKDDLIDELLKGVKNLMIYSAPKALIIQRV